MNLYLRSIPWIILFFFLTTACSASSSPTVVDHPSETEPAIISTQTDTPHPTPSSTSPPPTQTFTPVPPTPTHTVTPPPFVESLKAVVTADLLSCRYGPGAEYLYLYALRKSANIKLIGRTDGNNWVMVDGKNLCWVNAKFLEIAGDPKSLRIRYPEGYRIPVSPYYAPPAVLRASRDPNNPSIVSVTWTDITLRPGDEEDENMFIYIVEVWHCEGGQMIFDPLASNYPEITFIDEPGCTAPSHGRVFFQEKHGYAGPAEIPWPAQ